MKIPFTFRWIGSFSFIIQFNENERHVIQDEFSQPNQQWKFRTFRSNNSRVISLRYRVTCDLYYHSKDCATFCRSRDDIFGHYSCEEKSGRKICLEGWKDENCDKPKCLKGCNEMHGFCDAPDQCTCRNGWKGIHCDQCVEYPGCLHGYCLSPFQCICHRNWGGILCDQDLNYCGTHEPCLNSGQCENIAPDHYRCLCKPGFSGINCQTVIDSCATLPCLHSGTCLSRHNGSDFECLCKKGFEGKRCEKDFNECISSPCLNGGQCHDLTNDFRCTCDKGWTGTHCQLDIDECETLRPCIRAKQCLNTNGSYLCVCESGFEGNQCETEVNDCEKNHVICQNGGFCIDLIDDFRCVCLNHFTGSTCERIDESVCNHVKNQLWTYNDSNCQRLCVCHENHVICTCEERHMTCPENRLTGFPEQRIKLQFDILNEHGHGHGHQLNSICSTLHTLHTLISKSRDFCCHVISKDIIIISSRDIKSIENHVTKTFFPQLRHIYINNVSNNNSSNISSFFDSYQVISVFFCALFLFILLFVFIFYFYLKKREINRNEENVNSNEFVINCIQNNLKNDSKLRNQSILKNT